MPDRFYSCVLVAVLAAALGCASHSPQPGACPTSVGDALAKPALLREQADAALADGNLELAYRYLALIETLHPESAESRELFPAAAKLFKQLYFRHRIGPPGSPWATHEPVFMFHWLASFFENTDEFPEEPMATLFVGLPLGVYDDFVAYAKTQPSIARWQMRVRDDNGRVEAISGRLAAGAGARVTAGSR